MAAIPPSVEAPQEPLELSAPLARRLAPQLCHKDPASGESCAWQHGLWQYLRILGMNHSPRAHAAFLLEALAATARPGMRVLVSGAADYSMLAHVLAATRAAEVTVLDVCETPLE